MSENNTGRFVWYELMTTDPKAAQAFYTEVIGWKTQPYEGDYTMWVSGQGPMGGVIQLPESAKAMGAQPHWFAHVEVANVDRTVARVRELGGKVIVEPQDIPKIGRFSIVADPQGASISVFTPEGNSMGGHDMSKPGEVCWHELFTTDQKAAIAFYGEIFGWEKVAEHDMGPHGVYLLYGRNGAQLGGIMNKTPDMPMPPSFVYYVQVDGLDAAIERAKRMGAKVLVGPIPVPGGARVAQLLDPQGAWFALHENAKPAA